jgi:hypothetical protein
MQKELGDIVDINKIIISQLNDCGFSDVELTLVKEHPPIINPDGSKFYEKERLLGILKGRLKGVKMGSGSHPKEDFLKDSIDKIESIPDDSIIYFWEGNLSGKNISGRSTVNTLLQIYET